MKRLAFLMLILVCGAKLMAEPEPANYNIAVSKFKAFYNAGQPDSVFSMFSPDMKTALPLDKFTATTTQLKAQLGDLNKTEFLKYNQPLAVYRATFQHAVFLLNIALNVQSQFTGLRLTPDDTKVTSTIAMDPSLVETPITLKTLTGTISGTLTMPKDVSGKIPVVLIIAGSGPTDRDGNSVSLGLKTNAYKLLANELGKNGIASVRYDKRMVGQSTGTQKEKELRFEDYSDDATSLVEMLNGDDRFSKIIIAGHSEGSLVGMLATHDEPVKGYISLDGAGVPAEKILTEQLKSQPAYLGTGMKRVLDSLRRGKTYDQVDPQLYFIARPSIQTYLMSWCRYDPAVEIHKLKMPILIIQGTNDLQVGVDNGQKLKSAKSSATLVIVRGMNHILKDAPADKDKNLATYSNPDLPLNTEMVTTVVDFIKGLK